jgi:hypothetical protein
MTLNLKLLKRAIPYWIGGLLCFAVAIVMIYLGGVFIHREVYHPFDMDGFMTIPTLLQASILFQISLICLGMFFFSRNSGQRPSPRFWLVQSVLLFYISLDELFKLHLGRGSSSWMPIAGTKYWIGIYSGLIVAIAVFFFRDFKAIWNFSRNLLILGVCGLLLALIGAFGAEIFKHLVLNPLLATHFPDREVLTWVIEQVRVAFEEFLETLGGILILYATLLFSVKKIEQKYSDFLEK